MLDAKSECPTCREPKFGYKDFRITVWIISDSDSEEEDPEIEITGYSMIVEGKTIFEITG